MSTKENWYAFSPPQKVGGGNATAQWLTDGNSLRVIITAYISDPFPLATQPEPDPFMIVPRREPNTVESSIAWSEIVSVCEVAEP